jgi:hypothetical protein
MRLHGGDGYVPDYEEARRMEAEHAARLASRGFMRAQQDLDRQRAFEAVQAQVAANEAAQAARAAQAQADQVRNAEAQKAAQQRADEMARQAAAAQVQASYVAAPQTYAPPPVPTSSTISTSGLTATTPNWAGTPTVYTDANGNVKGVYTSLGVVPVESLNPLVPKGEQITADTLVQAVNADGQKLYLSDMTDPNSVTTRNTGIPAIGGTVAEQAFVPPKDNSVFGTIGGDFVDMAKDPAFHKFLAAAAAIASGGMAINAAIGAPAAAGVGGSVATAYPIAEAGLLGATELGAAGAAGGTGALGAGGMSAAEAIALAAEGGLGAEFGVQGALGGAELLGAAGAGGLTDAQAALLMEQGVLPAGMQTPAAVAGAGLTDAQAALLMEQGILPASMQTPAGGVLGSLQSLIPEGVAGSLIKGGLTLGGLAAAQALTPKPSTTGTGSQSLSAEQLQAIVAGMPSAMGNYLNMANTPYAGGVGVPGSANQNLVNLFPGFSLPTAGPFYGAGRFGDYYAPQAASTTPISPTGLV